MIRESENPNEHIKYRNSKLTLLLRDIFTSAEQKTVFIACVAPLQRDWKHTRSTLLYTSQLKTIEDVTRGRVCTSEELTENMLQFYAEKAPKFATASKVSEILRTFVGKERELYRRLTAKYHFPPIAACVFVCM